LYADVNTRGSVVLLDAARRHGVGLFVLASTSSVYGNTQRIPFSEADAPDFPLAPYPASKRSAEIFAHTYTASFGLNVTVLRFFNVYGPNGRPDMMPLRTMRAILSGETITAYDDGTMMRDWTYIDDILDGVVAALERPGGYRIYNLGSGAPLPLTEFIAHFERLIGMPALVKSAPAPVSEPHITFCDNSLARAELDFAPQVAISEGLARTWAWYKQLVLKR
jgi:UDP-glucuronate 4-epimerase